MTGCEHVTRAVYKALAVLAEHGTLRPREFARFMWPDAAGWNRPAKCGPYGVHRGGGMYLAAGGFLGKLRRLGYVERRLRCLGGDEGYAITAEGQKAWYAAWKSAVARHEANR